jgi:hypothetical protein
MEEEFKVIINVEVYQIPKVIELLKNKKIVVFNSTQRDVDAILKETFIHSTDVNFHWGKIHAYITNSSADTWLPTLREKGTKIRILK